MAKFIEKEISTLNFNPFKKIDNEWMLLTAGEKKAYNMMTASWGSMGVLWNKYIINCYVRPQRYTHEFMDNNDYFSVSFFEDTFRPAMTLCGRVSGRDVNKTEEANLTPVLSEKAPYFSESCLVFICKKIYTQKFDPKGFLARDIEENYKDNDYHTLFTGEIIKVLEKTFQE